jgi:methylglutaconyl-CoA hydratase
MTPLTFTDIRLDVNQGVARITMMRPERRNAFDAGTVAQLHAAIDQVAVDDSLRLLVLQADGPVFCAGADLRWMRAMADLSPAANLADAQGLADMLWALAHLPLPTLACVQGDCMGGGVGLVAACDLVLASDAAGFALSEVKLGLIPATIGPHVVKAIGARAAQALMLTGERINAERALALGLVHRCCPAGDLAAEADAMVKQLLRNGPAAMRAAKQLVQGLRERPLDEATRDWTAQRIATLRASEEGREGVQAFLQRRPPAWWPQD